MKKKLEDVIRKGESPDDLVLLLRGGEDSREKLTKNAHLLEEGFTYGGGPARGISLFAAHGDIEAWTVLGGPLKTYRRYRRIPAADLINRFLLVPTFTRSHWTLLLQSPDGSELPERELVDELLAILGPVLDNPKWEPRRMKARRNPRKE